MTSPTDALAPTGAPELLRSNLGWLCRQIQLAYLRDAESVLDGVAGGIRGYHVLAAVASGCTTNQLDVCRQLGIDRSVMVGVLDSLEQGGLVRRVPNPNDRRERLIHLTDAGTATLAEVGPRMKQAADDLLAPLSLGERASLFASLNRIVANVTTTG